MTTTTFQSVRVTKLNRQAKREAVRFAVTITLFATGLIASSSFLAVIGFNIGMPALAGVFTGAAIVAFGALVNVLYTTFKTLRHKH